MRDPWGNGGLADVEAKHRAVYASSASARARSASKVMLAAWQEAAEALDGGGRGVDADLAALGRLKAAEGFARMLTADLSGWFGHEARARFGVAGSVRAITIH